MSIYRTVPETGVFSIRGDISQNGKHLINKDALLVLSECAIITTALINSGSAPKVVGMDTSVTAYDSATGLVKAKTLFSLTTQEVLGVAVSSIPALTKGVLVTRGIINSTLTGTTVGEAVYATSSGELSLTLSSKRIGHILTLGLNAKVFVDIKTENSAYWTNQLLGAGSIPSGFVTSCLQAFAPTGWLLCNGSSQLTATYPNLFAVIGYNYGGSGANFNVPDYRGMFLRGTGSHGTLQTAAGGNFSGPALHGSQLDMEQSHKHVDSGHAHGFPGGPAYGFVYGFPTGPSDGGFGSANWYYDASSGVGSSTAVIGTQTTDGVNGTPRTGAETRPVNFGVNYIIRV